MKSDKEILERADMAIKAARKNLAKSKESEREPIKKRTYKRKNKREDNWSLCPDCGKNKIAPWNKSDRCSECQQYKKIPKKK